MIDSVDAAGDSFDVFDDRNEPCATAIWNGRLVNIPGPMPQYPSKLFQFSPQTNPFPHHVEQLDLSDEPSEFVFAPTTFSHEFTFQSPGEIFLSKGFFHRLYHEVKEGAKKVGKLAKKALKAITHGTKKAAHKVEHFVKDHKKEILIATAVIAAVSGAFALSGVLGTSAAAVNTPPKKKEEEEDKKTSASPPPPPPLPDWVQGLLQSTAPNFSPETASDAEIEQAKSEAHNAWETLNHIKALTEADLAHLRKEDPDFDPTKTAIETVLNTVLSDAQRHEFSKTSAAQQHWQDLIRTGHERIDQGFSAVAAHKAAAIAPPPPLPLAPTFSFIDPQLLDTYTRLDVFLKGQKITAPIDNPYQTVSEFMNKITEQLETIGRASIDPGLLVPNSPWDLFLQNQTENRNQSTSQFFTNLKEKPCEESFICKLDRPLPFGIATHSVVEQSRYFKTDGVSKDWMLITFINGMDNNIEDAFGGANYLHHLSPGKLCIEGIFNHTNSPAIDLLEAIALNYWGTSPKTKDLLIKKWTEFHEKNSDKPDAKILHFCHSQGTIHTRNALMDLPKEIRDRIIVVSLAPAAVIPAKMCFKSFNYASDRDIVHLGDTLSSYWHAEMQGGSERDKLERFAEALKMRDELVILKSHDGAKGFDHHLITPTLRKPIIDVIKDYEKHEGNYP